MKRKVNMLLKTMKKVQKRLNRKKQFIVKYRISLYKSFILEMKMENS